MVYALRFLFVLALSLSPLTLLAQPDPIRFGRVSAEDFQLMPERPDSSATAVILADYGNTYFRDGRTLVFERHRRIKILTEGGFDWGTHSVTYYAGRDRQTVSGLRAQSYTLGPDGKVSVHKLDRRSTFNENLDGEYKRIRFTVPALAPGTIVEYRYTITSPSPMYAPDWSFQTSEPTLWSEYRFTVPDGFEYVRAANEVSGLFVQESVRTNSTQGNAMRHRWVMKEVPALRQEPFMTALSDYTSHIRFQLYSYTFPGRPPQRVLTTWPELGRELMQGSFGRQLRAGREVNEAAAAAVQGKTTEFEKMVALYDYVRKTVRFSGGLGVFPDQEARQVLRTRSGSSPEIALLLTSMLRSQGLTANPVLISTRNHGRVIDLYPLVRQFNDVIVHVQTSEGEYFLDATDEHRPYNLLSPSALNGQGWLVSERDERWVPIPATSMFTRGTEVTASLDPSGTLTGRLRSRNDGYAAVEMREHLSADFDRDKFVREIILDGISGVEVGEYTLDEAQVGGEQVAVEAGFSTASFAQAAGDLLFFNPILTDRHETNPLKLAARSFPVDYAFPRSRTYELRLTLPDGYRLLEQPRSRDIRHPKGGALYRRIVRVEDDALVVQTLFQVSRVVFEPREYADLQEFYAQIVASEAEQIVLTRVAELEAVVPEVVGVELALPEDEAGR